MDRVVKKHLPVIIAATLICFFTGASILTFVHGNAASMTANVFALLLFLVPCVLMFVGSAVIAATASEIGRGLYLTVLVVSLVAGLIAMVITSTWLEDPAITAPLLANSPEGTVITPILKSPITMLRDVAAFVVIPTIGCIFGAWLGSRLHPMKGEPNKKKKGKSKR